MVLSSSTALRNVSSSLPLPKPPKSSPSNLLRSPPSQRSRIELSQLLAASHRNLRIYSDKVSLRRKAAAVRSYQANTHAKKGWEQFTDAAIRTISEKKKGVVFLLRGNYAQAKLRLIDEPKHHILILQVYLPIKDFLDAACMLRQPDSRKDGNRPD